jgi:hypothetical protein
MAKLKITFRKEVWADLNAYYPNFPPALRKAIDNAIYKLLGGQETKAPIQRSNVSTSGANKGVIYRLTGKVPERKNTKMGALLADIASNYKSGECLKEDVLKLATQHKMQESSVLHNAVGHKYLELVE